MFFMIQVANQVIHVIQEKDLWTLNMFQPEDLWILEMFQPADG